MVDVQLITPHSVIVLDVPDENGIVEERKRPVESLARESKSEPRHYLRDGGGGGLYSHDPVNEFVNECGC